MEGSTRSVNQYRGPPAAVSPTRAKTGTRERQVYVSMYLSAPKMGRTYYGRGIDIKQRPGIEQITIYTGRTDDRDTVNAQSRSVTCSQGVKLRPARRADR